MARLRVVVSGLALSAIIMGMVVPVGAQGGKAPTIKEIMGKAHKGNTSLLTLVGMQLKMDPPQWPDVQKETHELVSLGESLGQQTPPKGAKESWSKLTQAYVQNAKELEAAAQKQEKQAAVAAHGRLTGSCKACHTAHRS